MTRTAQPRLSDPMTDAVRARTILALGGPAAWRLEEGELVIAPFVAFRGTPLLLLDHEDVETVLEQARVGVVLRPSPRLGSLTLTGMPRVPSMEEHGGELRRYRQEHADCGPACGARAVAVAVEVEEVEVEHVEIAGEARPAGPLSLPQFLAAEPREDLMATHAIAHHLNTAHAGDLRAFAERVSSAHAGSLVAAQVADITADGLTLTLIDRAGATPLDVVFSRPVLAVEALGDELHRLLAAPGRPQD